MDDSRERSGSRARCSVALARYQRARQGRYRAQKNAPAMITLRKGERRHCDQRNRQTIWLTFYPRGRVDRNAERFGVLESLSEYRLPPNAHAPRHLYHNTEIVTFVREGALACEDSTGHSDIIQSGEFQRLTAKEATRRTEKNASTTEWAHVFQIWLRPSRTHLVQGHEKKRFSMAERRGLLCTVASPDARGGSLRIHQDALTFSALLDPGQHLVHELPQGRSAWLHIVQGKAALEGLALTSGDGVGITAERSVSLTAQEETEILLLDLCESA